MASARFQSEGDKPILVIDLAHVSDTDTISDVVREATLLAQSSTGPGTLLTLLDLTGTRVNRSVLSSLKSLSEKNGRYAKATAFVGLNGFWTLVMTTMFRMRGKRNHKVFATRTEATEWLARWV